MESSECPARREGVFDARWRRRTPCARSPPPTQEVDGLKGAVQQLKTSSDKLVISKMSLDQLEKTEDGTRMLVPMTSSLYVNGETTPLQHVLVDVGTGYYIEKSAAEAQAFFDRKIELIKNQVFFSLTHTHSSHMSHPILPICHRHLFGGAVFLSLTHFPPYVTLAFFLCITGISFRAGDECTEGDGAEESALPADCRGN